MMIAKAPKQMMIAKAPKQMMIAKAPKQMMIAKAPKQMMIAKAPKQMMIAKAPKQMMIAKAPKQIIFVLQCLWNIIAAIHSHFYYRLNFTITVLTNIKSIHIIHSLEILHAYKSWTRSYEPSNYNR